MIKLEGDDQNDIKYEGTNGICGKGRGTGCFWGIMLVLGIQKIHWSFMSQFIGIPISIDWDEVGGYIKTLFGKPTQIWLRWMMGGLMVIRYSYGGDNTVNGDYVYDWVNEVNDRMFGLKNIKPTI